MLWERWKWEKERERNYDYYIIVFFENINNKFALKTWLKVKILQRYDPFPHLLFITPLVFDRFITLFLSFVSERREKSERERMIYRGIERIHRIREREK